MWIQFLGRRFSSYFFVVLLFLILSFYYTILVNIYWREDAALIATEKEISNGVAGVQAWTQMREITSNFFSQRIQIYKSAKVNVQHQAAYLLVQRYHANIDLSLSSRVEKVCEILLIIRPSREGKCVYLSLRKIFFPA